MRSQGTITSWNDEKGFGFITPAHGTKDVFLHIRALPPGRPRPVGGETVSYDLTYDEQKRLRAMRAEIIGQGHGFFRVHAGLLFPAAFLLAVLAATLAQVLPPWVAIVYFSASAVTALAYAADKMKAQDGAFRISETTLHWLEAAGGWPGALVAQRVFRHKTRKRPFQIIFWLIVLAHLALWGGRLVSVLGSG